MKQVLKDLDKMNKQVKSMNEDMKKVIRDAKRKKQEKKMNARLNIIWIWLMN